MNNEKITKKASNSKKLWSQLLQRKNSRDMIKNSWKDKDSKSKFSKFIKKF